MVEDSINEVRQPMILRRSPAAKGVESGIEPGATGPGSISILRKRRTIAGPAWRIRAGQQGHSPSGSGCPLSTETGFHTNYDQPTRGRAR